MENQFIDIDSYQILVKGKKGYLSIDDLAQIFSADKKKIQEDFKNRCKEKKEYVTVAKTTYYSLDVIVLAGFDYDYKIVFHLYDTATEKGLRFQDYVTKRIEEERTSLQTLTSLIDNKQDLMDAFYKYQDSGEELNSYTGAGTITTESLQMMITLLKEKYHLGPDFGVIKNYSTLLDILFFENATPFDDELDDDEFGDDVAYIVRSMYNIIQKKPFVSGNEIIAVFLAYYYLDQAGLVDDEGTKINSLEDLSLAAGLLMGVTGKKAITTMKKVKSLLANHYGLSSSDTSEELPSILDDSEEGILNYIISSIENFKGYQGYYEYFKGDICVHKIHYHGYYKDFELEKAKTFLAEKTLCFKGTLYCSSEAPHDLHDREAFLKDIVEEIKVRSYNDVILPFLSKLKEKVKPYFDLDSISIQFDFDYKIKYDEDYD